LETTLLTVFAKPQLLEVLPESHHFTTLCLAFREDPPYLINGSWTDRYQQSVVGTALSIDRQTLYLVRAWWALRAFVFPFSAYWINVSGWHRKGTTCRGGILGTDCFWNYSGLAQERME
jgi:hypothetical protein